MRRTATVTHCVPEAASACTIVGMSRYLPVPRNSRDVNVCLPSTSGRSTGVVTRLIVRLRASTHKGRGGALFPVPLSPAEERHDLEPVAVGEHRRSVVGPAHQLAVAFDGDLLGPQP